MIYSLDLDAWINDPPSDSEEETETRSNQYENNQTLFSGDNNDSYYHASNLDPYGGDQSEYNKGKNYVELTQEEVEERRERRKQTEKLNPFYLKDSSKPKTTQQVVINYLSFCKRMY